MKLTHGIGSTWGIRILTRKLRNFRMTVQKRQIKIFKMGKDGASEKNGYIRKF